MGLQVLCSFKIDEVFLYNLHHSYKKAIPNKRMAYQSNKNFTIKTYCRLTLKVPLTVRFVPLKLNMAPVKLPAVLLQ
jgi:hypothetical protein